MQRPHPGGGIGIHPVDLSHATRDQLKGTDHLSNPTVTNSPTVKVQEPGQPGPAGCRFRSYSGKTKSYSP